MSPEERARSILPTAAGLAVAVADCDRGEVHRHLEPLDREQLVALAVVLAAHVDMGRPMSTALPMPLAPDEVPDRAMNIAAALFGVSVSSILSTDRRREVLDARAVAMAACRLCGLSCVFLGDRFSRDHSTVSYAAARVGEDPRLRGLAQRVAMQCGWDRNREDAA